MKVLRHAPEVSAYIQTHPESEIATLIQQRTAELLDEDTPMEELVFFVIVQEGDDLAALEQAIQSPCFTIDGHPLWEVIEAHSTCFEMVFVLDQSGYGAIVLVPDTEGMDAHLLEQCRVHATPE